MSLPFSDRSAGFIWFFSFLVAFSQVQKEHGNVVILLDEPGLNLHGRAQADLLRYITERLMPKHQVIYTTHSPFMVPADKLDVALDQLSAAQIGTVLQRTTASQDVTAQDVDTQSRLKTMRSSVDRVRALMAQAKDIGQVVVLESELSRREADLESLESQLAALNTAVDRSTLAVSLSTPGNEPVSDNGFLAGLRSGWDAFTASAAGLFKGLGAVLPFAVFFALVGAPIWWSLRRRRANRPAVVAAATTQQVKPVPEG